MRNPESIAVKQYAIYKQAAGKTAKSILISVGVRLAAFNLKQIANLTCTDDLNEQADDRLACIISQMQDAEGVTEELKACDQLAWVGAMNSIRSRAEEIILSEMIFA